MSAEHKGLVGGGGDNFGEDWAGGQVDDDAVKVNLEDVVERSRDDQCRFVVFGVLEIIGYGFQGPSLTHGQPEKELADYEEFIAMANSGGG